MTDKREPIPESERAVQGVALQALGKEFEHNADELASALVAIATWLRAGAPSDTRPEYAFLDCTGRMDRCYFLLGEIHRVEGRASRT